VLGAGAPSWAKGDSVSALERALLAPPSTSAIPAGITELRQHVAAVRSVFQLGHYTESASRLPAVLSTAMATRAEAKNPAEANGLLADLYTLASELMVKLNRTQSALITVTTRTTPSPKPQRTARGRSCCVVPVTPTPRRA
jgi:hypothetical protein